MRYLTPSELLAGIAVTLKESVLPDCESRQATGQLWAAIGLIENLATRLVEDDQIVDDEADAARRVGQPAGWSEPTLAQVRSHVREQMETSSGTGATAEIRSYLDAVEEIDRRYRRPTHFYKAFR